jgi:hypothetical protein
MFPGLFMVLALLGLSVASPASALEGAKRVQCVQHCVQIYNGRGDKRRLCGGLAQANGGNIRAVYASCLKGDGDAVSDCSTFCSREPAPEIWTGR